MASLKRPVDAMSDVLERAAGGSEALSPPVKIPKAVADVQSKIGAGLTPKKLRANLAPKEYNSFSNNFRNSLTTAEKAQHKGMTKEDKDAWMCQWAIDSALCTLQGFNKTVVYTDEVEIEEDRWATEEQITDILKSEKHMRILLGSKELEVRDHRYKSLAAAGVKQHKLIEELYQMRKGKKQEAGASASTELKDHEYEAAVSGMVAAKVTDKVKKNGSERESRSRPEGEGVEGGEYQISGITQEPEKEK